MKNYAAILFDLDGTLADTAPDLSFTLNEMLKARGLSPVPPESVRAVASSGAGGLISKGFGIERNLEGFDDLRQEFLGIYQENLTRSSKLFSGIDKLLGRIEENNIPWGVVTNKAHRFTVPVLKGLEIFNRAACIVSGDSTPYPKPHPAPLLQASKTIGVLPENCIYVGDDERDIKAAKAANMDSIVALYGYLGINNPPQSWGATTLIDKPNDLIKILGI